MALALLSKTNWLYLVNLASNRTDVIASELTVDVSIKHMQASYASRFVIYVTAT